MQKSELGRNGTISRIDAQLRIRFVKFGCFAVLLCVFSTDPTPVLAQNYLQYGNECLKRADWTKALTYFRSEISNNPQSPDGHWGAAKALSKMKQLPEAIRELESTISLADPKSSIGIGARNALSILRARVAKNKPQEAPVAANKRAASAAAAKPVSMPGVPAGLSASGATDWKKQHDALQTQLKANDSKWFSQVDHYKKYLAGLPANDPARPMYEQCIVDFDKSRQVEANELIEVYTERMQAIEKTDRQKYAKPVLNQPVMTKEQKAQAQIKDEISTRQQSLQMAFDAKAAAIRAETEHKKRGVNDTYAPKLSAAATPEELRTVRGERDAAITHLDVQSKYDIFLLKRQLKAQQSALAAMTNTLQSAGNNEDIKFVPVGKTNLYSRSFRTFGDASGNPVPLTAEPGSLQALPNK